MDHSSSPQKAPRSASRLLISILLVLVILAGAGGIAFIWLMIEPVHVVEGMVRIVPVVRDLLTGEARPDDTADYVQFVNTQALVLMSDEKRLQKIVDDLAGRNLAFFSRKPGNRIERFLATIMPNDTGGLPDRILQRAIVKREITAGYLPGSELMAVTMKSRNPDEAPIIVNSFLRNYVGQYGVDATTQESQSIAVLEDQRNEIQKRILESRSKIRDLAMAYGTTELDPLQKMEMSSQNMLQSELMRLEAARIKIEADIGVYEKTEKLELAPEQIAAARTEHINSDPLIKELTSRIIQMEVDLIVAGQTPPPADPADTQREVVLKALQQKLDEKRLALAEEFDGGLENKLKEAARQRVIQVRTEKAQIEAHIAEIRRVLSDQETRMVRVGNASLDIQDIQRKLAMDEETLDKVNRRLVGFEMERDRRPRVQIASLAEVKEVVDPRWQWTFVAIIVTAALGLVLWNTRRTVGLPPESSGS